MAWTDTLREIMRGKKKTAAKLAAEGAVEGAMGQEVQPDTTSRSPEQNPDESFDEAELETMAHGYGGPAAGRVDELKKFMQIAKDLRKSGKERRAAMQGK